MSSPPFFLRNSRASKTQVPLMSLEVRCKWLNLMGKLSSIFELISQRGRRGFLPGSWSWKTLQWIEFRQKKWHFFCDWSRSLPDQNDQHWLRPFRQEQWLCILGDLGAVSQLKHFHPTFSPDPTDCPWVSEDIDGGYAIKAKKNSSSWADTKHRGIHHM